MKAIINLDGTSSEVVNKEKILTNIIYVLKLMQIPYEIYENKQVGFQRLWFDMNQPETLYILNDSLMYHLCEQKCILISRSAPWVVSTPKPNVIGQLTQEMISTEVSVLMAILHRDKAMRQHSNGSVARTYLMVNDYQPQLLERIGMFGAAAWSWNEVSKYDIHFKPVFHINEKKGLPLVNDILKEGLELFQHPDDILIIANRDICFVKEAPGIIRAYMDSLNIDACHGHRVDVKFNGLLHYENIVSREPATGIDFFAFRPDAECINKLINIDLYLGRVGWDSLWASETKYKLPYNVCYHYPHNSEWTYSEAAQAENHANIIKVRDNTKLKVVAGVHPHFETSK